MIEERRNKEKRNEEEKEEVEIEKLRNCCLVLLFILLFQFL
jgi:hypothetical protein